MGLSVGIDLGTTYSVVAYVDGKTKQPTIIKNKLGKNITPSVVGIHCDGTYVIGEDAKLMEEEGDINTASFYKLHMGNHNHKIFICDKEYTALDLSSLYLKRLIEEAKKVIGEDITDAVITVPAYFEDPARNDTMKAGKNAGLNILNIISEPTAACVAYGLREDGLERKILIYDLGGGTFDVTIAQVKKDSIEVLGTNGHHQLGGRDWDAAIASWLTNSFLEETGIDISNDSEVAAANMVKAEKAKQQLTTAQSVDIIVDNGEQKCRFKLTRGEFEELTSYQLGITMDIINDLFEDIGISWADLDGAILVGGSTKMPMVRNYIIENNVKILDGVHPDEAVAIGAALQANISNFCALTLEDKKKSSLSLESKKKVNLALLPGAKFIKDVISHSLGMIVSNEDESAFVNDIMIKRNTSSENAHMTKRRELRVGKKEQNNKLEIYLLQGESEEPLNCTIIKKYVFTGISYVNRGRSNIDIKFSHTINGTVDISAIQCETGKNLKCNEDSIPEDMSWLNMSPKEYFRQNSNSSNEKSGALIMALDVSGSMEGSTLNKAKEAMKNFVKEFIGSGIEIGIVAFAEEVVVTCDPTENEETIDKAIKALEVGNIGKCAPKNPNVSVGYCTSANPLEQIHKMLQNYGNEDFAYGIVLTDGIWDKKDEAKYSKRKFISDGFELIGMGFGTADINFLKEISTRQELAKVDDINSLNSNLSSIAKIISN